MKYSRIFIALSILAVLTSFAHPFFVSVTEVEYSSKTKELGMVIKVFPDDLEETLRKFTGKKYDVIQGQKKEINPVIDQYIQKHISIKLNGTLKAFRFLGYEIDKESVLIYFSISNQPGISVVEINSNLMYEYRPEQTNIVHIKLDNKRESFRLTTPYTKAILKK